jgi:nucleoid-associated protein YgaU
MMRRHILFLLALSLLAFAGCESKNQQPAARQEEPYTPRHTTLDAMDAAPATDAAAPSERLPVEMTVDTQPPEPSGNESDELLVPAGAQVYTVQKGDTLYKVARRFYNDQSRWREIWEANKTRLPDPDKLPIGIKLIIP